MNCQRPHSDPDDDSPCPLCEGEGFQCWYDADTGYEHEACPACGGNSVIGVFVLQIVTARFQHELTYHTANFPKAIARAERFASLASGRKMFGWRPSHVNVVFLATANHAMRTCPPEIVATIPVPIPSRTPTAA